MEPWKQKVPVRAKKKQNWFWMILKETKQFWQWLAHAPALPRNWRSESANSHQHFAKTTQGKYSILTVCSSVINCVSVTWVSKRRVCISFKSNFLTFLSSFKWISLKHARANCVSSHITSYNKELLFTITRYVSFSSFKDLLLDPNCTGMKQSHFQNSLRKMSEVAGRPWE